MTLQAISSKLRGMVQCHMGDLYLGKKLGLDSRQATGIYVPCPINLSVLSSKWMTEMKGLLFKHTKSHEYVRSTLEGSNL